VAAAIQNLRNDSMVLDSPSKRLDVLAAYAGGQLAAEPQPSRHRPQQQLQVRVAIGLVWLFNSSSIMIK